MDIPIARIEERIKNFNVICTHTHTHTYVLLLDVHVSVCVSEKKKYDWFDFKGAKYKINVNKLF